MDTLTCPQRHADTDPVALRRDVEDYAAATTWDNVRAALLRSGYCVACPSQQLTDETVTLYGQDRPAGRCRCCGALWLAEDDDSWTLLDQGRLA